MRERFDAGTVLVALGAVLLIVSLFIDWFQPGGEAWAVFEWVDIFLAGAAMAALAALVSRSDALATALPWIAFAALAVVAVQLIDLPPDARGAGRRAGARLALGGSVVMALGAALALASISVIVDVRGRERRRRTAAIDARESAAAEPDAEEGEAAADALWGGRRGAAADSPGAARRRSPEAVPPEPDPDRTQSLEPIERPEERA